MKKFAVLMKIGTCSAKVVREFDKKDDAYQYATLMQISEDCEHTSYHVCEILSDASTALA